MIRRSIVLLAALAACSHSHPVGHHGEGMHRRFDKPEEWSARFDDPGRDRWQKPDEAIRALALPPDAKVADIGAGTGYFTMRLARALPRGKVYGQDVEPEMVRYLEQRARREGLANVIGVVGGADDARLPEAVDLVLVVDTYHHIDHRPAYFRRLQEKLTPAGRGAIIDFRRRQPMGPPDAHKIPADQVKAEMAAAGYRVTADLGFLPNQHFLIFAR
jgi:cyclopropane fatty-acyl-phospholipid synthase-like methyltransferase